MERIRYFKARGQFINNTVVIKPEKNTKVNIKVWWMILVSFLPRSFRAGLWKRIFPVVTALTHPVIGLARAALPSAESHDKLFPNTLLWSLLTVTAFFFLTWTWSRVQNVQRRFKNLMVQQMWRRRRPWTEECRQTVDGQGVETDSALELPGGAVLWHLEFSPFKTRFEHVV